MTHAASLKAHRLEDLTFTEFLRLAIKRLAIAKETQPDKNLWLYEEPARLHRTVLELKHRLEGQLPPLKRIRFITGGPFPYSKEIVQSLDLLQQANAISRENPKYQRFSPKVFKDTRQVLDQDLTTIFGENEPARKAFESFVQGLSEVIAHVDQ